MYEMKKNEVLHDVVSKLVMKLEPMNFDDNPSVHAQNSFS